MIRVAICAFALGAIGCAALPGTPGRQDVQSDVFAGRARDLRQLAERAYVWGMPLVEAGLIRSRFAASSAAFNRFSHRRTLSGPEMRAGVAPNNDTLYSLTWVDLSDGPLVVTLPDFGKRYYTLSINQADSSAEQSLGQRTHGGQLPPLFVYWAGKPTRVPAGMVAVPVSTRFANLAGRILAKGPEEYKQVHTLQNAMAIHRWADWQQGIKDRPADMQGIALSPRADVPANLKFLDLLGQLLRDWQPRNPREAKMIASFASLGIGPSGFDLTRLNSAQRQAVADGLAEGEKLVAARSLRLGTQANGWTTNYLGPRFGKDWLLRAAVAKDQIFVAVPEEALYPVGRKDAQGQPLDASHRYRIHFAKGQLPPVNAFWSITAYGDDGFMMPNALGRYSVGDRTAGLVHDKNGGTTILLSREDPKDSTANWLPVGPGPFYLMLRLYLPKEEVLKRRWLPPAIEAIR